MVAQPRMAASARTGSPDPPATRDLDADQEGTCCVEKKNAPPQSCSTKTRGSPARQNSAPDHPDQPGSPGRSHPPVKADRSSARYCTCSGSSENRPGRDNDRYGRQIDRYSGSEFEY